MCRLSLALLLGFMLIGCQATPDRQAGAPLRILLAGRPVTALTHGIFLPDDPTLTERTAAQELQTHLELVLGDALPILPESRREDRAGFFIGRSTLYPLDPATRQALGTEGILIRTIDDSVLLAGNERGVLYAVSVFLEDAIGIRWLTAKDTLLPTRGPIEIGDFKRQHVPKIAYRGMLYWNLWDGAFAMRSRINGATHLLTDAQGGRMPYGTWVHTFSQFVPSDTYFDEHPEYYALIGDQRRPPQLCLTNPDVLRTLTAEVDRRLRDNPDVRYISVSQDDNSAYCRCEPCTALAQKEDSQAGPLLHFVNAVADAIADDHPEVAVSTLAYVYTRKPPRHVRPRPNVVIRFCTYEACFSHPLADCPRNAELCKDFEGWRRIAPRLHVWDYTISYSHSIAPFPNLYVLKRNIQYFAEHGVESLFEQADQFSHGGEMEPLRTYIVTHTLWDPARDTDELIDEFLAGYYGPAAPHMRAYVDLVHEHFHHGRGYHATISGMDPVEYMPGDFVPRALALFDKAIRSAGDDETLVQRLRLQRLAVLYLVLRGSSAYAMQGDELVDTFAPKDGWLAEFRDVVAKEGIGHISEGNRIEPFLDAQVSPPMRMKVLRLRNDTVEVAVVPEAGGRVLSIRDRRTGIEVLRQFTADGRTRLMGSGIEAYSEQKYLSPGWREAYAVTSRADRRITLVADLSNGLRLHRSIAIAEHDPRVTIESRLENVSDTPRVALLRTHPAFAVRDMTQAQLLRRIDGTWRSQPLPAPEAAKAPDGWVWLSAEDVPEAAWGLADRATGQTVISRVLAGDVDGFYCHVSWQDQWASLELFSPKRTLQPGETIELTCEYELRSP